MSVCLEDPATFKGERIDYPAHADMCLVVTGDLEVVWDQDSVSFCEANHTSPVLRALHRFDSSQSGNFPLGTRNRMLRGKAPPSSAKAPPSLAPPRKGDRQIRPPASAPPKKRPLPKQAKAPPDKKPKAPKAEPKPKQPPRATRTPKRLASPPPPSNTAAPPPPSSTPVKERELRSQVS